MPDFLFCDICYQEPLPHNHDVDHCPNIVCRVCNIKGHGALTRLCPLNSVNNPLNQDNRESLKRPCSPVQNPPKKLKTKVPASTDDLIISPVNVKLEPSPEEIIPSGTLENDRNENGISEKCLNLPQNETTNQGIKVEYQPATATNESDDAIRNAINLNETSLPQNDATKNNRCLSQPEREGVAIKTEHQAPTDSNNTYISELMSAITQSPTPKTLFEASTAPSQTQPNLSQSLSAVSNSPQQIISVSPTTSKSEPEIPTTTSIAQAGSIMTPNITSKAIPTVSSGFKPSTSMASQKSSISQSTTSKNPPIISKAAPPNSTALEANSIKQSGSSKPSTPKTQLVKSLETVAIHPVKVHILPPTSQTPVIFDYTGPTTDVFKLLVKNQTFPNFQVLTQQPRIIKQFRNKQFVSQVRVVVSNTRPSAQRLDNEDCLTAWIVKGSNEAKSSDKHGTKSGGDELVDEGIIGLDKAASSSNPTEVISSSSAAKEDADKNHLAQVGDSEDKIKFQPQIGVILKPYSITQVKFIPKYYIDLSCVEKVKVLSRRRGKVYIREKTCNVLDNSIYVSIDNTSKKVKAPFFIEVELVYKRNESACQPISSTDVVADSSSKTKDNEGTVRTKESTSTLNPANSAKEDVVTKLTSPAMIVQASEKGQKEQESSQILAKISPPTSSRTGVEPLSITYRIEDIVKFQPKVGIVVKPNTLTQVWFIPQSSIDLSCVEKVLVLEMEQGSIYIEKQSCQVLHKCICVKVKNRHSSLKKIQSPFSVEAILFYKKSLTSHNLSVLRPFITRSLKGKASDPSKGTINSPIKDRQVEKIEKVFYPRVKVSFRRSPLRSVVFRTDTSFDMEQVVKAEITQDQILGKHIIAKKQVCMAARPRGRIAVQVEKQDTSNQDISDQVLSTNATLNVILSKQISTQTDNSTTGPNKNLPSCSTTPSQTNCVENFNINNDKIDSISTTQANPSPTKEKKAIEQHKESDWVLVKFHPSAGVFLLPYTSEMIQFKPEEDIDLSAVENATVLARKKGEGGVTVKSQSCCLADKHISVWVDNVGSIPKIIKSPFSIEVKLYYRKMFVEMEATFQPSASKIIRLYALVLSKFLPEASLDMKEVLKAEVRQDQTLGNYLVAKKQNCCLKDDGISVYVDNQDSDHHSLSKNFKLTLIITKKYSSNSSEKKNIEKVSVSTTKASVSEFEQSSHALPQANASTSKSSTTKRSSTNPASISKSSLPTPVNSKAGSSQHYSSVCQFKNKVSVAVFKKGKIPVLFYPDPVKDFAEIVKAEVLEEQVFSNNVVIKRQVCTIKSDHITVDVDNEGSNHQVLSKNSNLKVHITRKSNTDFVGLEASGKKALPQNMIEYSPTTCSSSSMEKDAWSSKIVFKPKSPANVRPEAMVQVYFFPESSLDLEDFDNIVRAEVVEEQILPRHIRVKKQTCLLKPGCISVYVETQDSDHSFLSANAALEVTVAKPSKPNAALEVSVTKLSKPNTELEVSVTKLSKPNTELEVTVTKQPKPLDHPNDEETNKRVKETSEMWNTGNISLKAIEAAGPVMSQSVTKPIVPDSNPSIISEMANLDLTEKAGYIRTYIEEDGLGFIMCEGYGLVVFHAQDVWSGIGKTTILPVGSKVAFYDRTFEGHRYDWLSPQFNLHQAVVLWRAEERTRPNFTHGSYLNKLNRLDISKDTLMVYVDWKVFLVVDMVSAEGTLVGYISHDMGVIECETEAGPVDVIFKSSHVYVEGKPMTQIENQVPVGTTARVDARMIAGTGFYQAVGVHLGQGLFYQHPIQIGFNIYVHMNLRFKQELDSNLDEIRSMLSRNNGELVFDWSDSCPITRHQSDINNGELVYDWSDSCPIPRHQSDSNHIHKALLYSGVDEGSPIPDISEELDLLPPEIDQFRSGGRGGVPGGSTEILFSPTIGRLLEGKSLNNIEFVPTLGILNNSVNTLDYTGIDLVEVWSEQTLVDKVIVEPQACDVNHHKKSISVFVRNSSLQPTFLLQKHTLRLNLTFAK